MINPDLYELLLTVIPKENILLDEPMTKHTSFKIGGNAECFIRAKSRDEVKFILEICNERCIPLTIVGNGSNLLVKDNGIKGIVLKVDIDYIEIVNLEETKEFSEGFKNKLIESGSGSNCLITVGAGVPLGKLAQILLKDSITGFEFASGIPGTIGGAVRMNAGAYGTEFKDIVVETTCMDKKGEIFKLSNSEQKFEYRRSIFKDADYVILETKLLLKRIDDNSTIKDKMDELKKSRLEKQPIEYPSAGSTFKRGNDFITAKLIDECGLKGYSVGGAQVATKHAGFVINTGNATAKDVLELIDVIKKSVLQKFNKEIELEIEVIGE